MEFVKSLRQQKVIKYMLDDFFESVVIFAYKISSLWNKSFKTLSKLNMNL